MKIETTSRKLNSNLARLILLMGIACYACAKDCKQQIAIYQGRYFKQGQIVELSIDDKILLKEKFEKEVQSNDLKLIEDYCCLTDSCKVRFVLGNSDTVFYLSPNKTSRLKVGSDINGNFSVATDEDNRAWIQM